MKIIKNTIILAAAALMMGAVSSCSDYLDKTPEGKVPDTQVDYANLDKIGRAHV